MDRSIRGDSCTTILSNEMQRIRVVSLSEYWTNMDRSGDDSHQQDDCWRQVHHSRHMKAERDAHNYLKMSTLKPL